MRRTLVWAASESHSANSPARAFSVTRLIKPEERVAIFPLHLDPPTIYHQQIFKMLVTKDESHLAGSEEGYDGVSDAMYRKLSQSGLVNYNTRNKHHHMSTSINNVNPNDNGHVEDAERATAYGQSKLASVDISKKNTMEPLSPMARATASGSTPIFNASSTTISPYGDDWETGALSRYSRRERLLSLLKECRNRNDKYKGYVNKNTIRSRAQSAVGAGEEGGECRQNAEKDADLIAMLKKYVVSSWKSSRESRSSLYGGLATALRDEIFLDSVSFDAELNENERELMKILQEQHQLLEYAYAGGTPDVSVGNGGSYSKVPSAFSETQPPTAGIKNNAGGGFTPYDLSQARTRQLLHRRRLPCQTELEIAEQCRLSIASSRLAPFDHLIVLPNSKYAAPIQQSRHLAAMASLSVRNLHPRVHMELYLLEHPEHYDTAIRDLTQHFKDSTIVHWLPNIAEVQLWQGYTELLEKVPMLVLRPKGFQFPSHSTYFQASQPPPSATDCRHFGQQSSSSGGDEAPAITSTFSHRAPATASTLSSSPRPPTSETADGCSVSSNGPSQDMNAFIAQTLQSRLSANHIEVIEVERLSGAGVRQLLWDRGTRHEEHGVIPSVVLRYMDSHGLYRDFRKGFLQSEQSLSMHPSDGLKSSNRLATSSFQATVALASLIPRLEIHHDRANSKARDLYEKLKVFECGDGRDPDLIVPIGGDGYMMHCIRQNWHRFIPFFGVNAGHRGYLLNDALRLDELFSHPLKLYHMPMLYCEAEIVQETNREEKSKSSPSPIIAASQQGVTPTPPTTNATPLKTIELRTELAFNDAWIDRATGQTAWIRVLVNGGEQLKRVRGDGVLVSTAAGSTAYAQALGASPIPADVQLIQLVGSNIVSPSRWRPVHLNQSDSVTLEVIDPEKRPCKVFVDSNCLGTAKSLMVRTSRVASVQLAFCHSYDLQQKLYQVQFPKDVEDF